VKFLTGVTITGADDAVDVCDLESLSEEFPFVEWETQMMPWLGGAVVPGWDGRIWPTHVIEVAA